MLKQIGQLIGFTVGSIFSPTLPMLTWVTREYFDMHVITKGPAAILAEITHYQMLVQANPEPVLTHMIPNMIAVMIFGGLFVWCIGWLGGRLLPMAWEKAQQVLNPASAPVIE